LKVVVIHSGFSEKNIFKQPWLCSYELSRVLSRLGHKVSILTDTYPGALTHLIDVEIKVVPKEHLRLAILLVVYIYAI